MIEHFEINKKLNDLIGFLNPKALELPNTEIILPDIDSVTITTTTLIESGIPLNQSIFITYKASDSEISQRRITVKRIVNRSDGDCDLVSFCHERDAPRTFILSKVVQITDISTGETIADPLYYFKGRYGNPEIKELSQIINKYNDQILVLVFIGRSDGALKKSERDVILEYIISLTGTNMDIQLLDNELKRLNCIVDDFRKYIKKLSVSLEYKEKINFIYYVDKVVKADKIIDPMESAALQVISSIFEVPTP